MQVSIIIPTYNYGRFLRDSIGSVQNQSIEDLEILVVDDGSTDDTREILASIAAEDPRVRAFHIPRTGVSDARNYGLDRAKGDFIAYLDADDRWRPNKLELQLAMMRSEPEVGLIFTNALRFKGDNEYFEKDRFAFLGGLSNIPSRPSRDGHGRIITTDAFVSLLPLPMLAPTPSTALLRAAHVEGVRWCDGLQRAPDLYYFMQACRRVGAGYISEHLVETRRHGGNSYTTRYESMPTFIRALEIMLDDSDEPLTLEHREALLRRLGRAWCGIGFFHFWRRQPFRACRAYLRSLAFPGSRLNALKHLVAAPAVPLLPSRAAEDEDFI